MQLKRNKEMEFETLKKSYNKQIIIGALAICVIGGALTFNLTRAKYKVTESIDLAKGTINYKPYDFKIMAMYQSEDGTNYTEIENRMPSSGYVINESKSYCTIDNKTHDTEAKLYTENGKHIFENLSKSDKCYLYFDKYIPPITISNIIAANNPKTTVPDFSTIADTDEGVYTVSDGMYGGTSYYWRGAATTNHVIFANKCWRIVRINGDGSMRLIYNGSVLSNNTCFGNGKNEDSIIEKNIPYNTSSNSASYTGWTYKLGYQRPSDTSSGTETSSNAKIKSEEWFNKNIVALGYEEKVADGKFCNDRDVANNETWIETGTTQYYAANDRINKNKLPTSLCNNKDIYVLKVGAISADEVAYAGFANPNNNDKFYLYNGQDYWTMTAAYKWQAQSVYIFYVSSLGGAVSASSGWPLGSLRPVINLRSNITFASGGDGTLNNPYVVQ